MKCSLIIFAAFAALVTAQTDTLIFSPVCASNGITYGNEHFLKYAASKDETITFLFRGTCVYSTWDEHVCGEPGFSEEFCGSDGAVYKNKCFFDFAVKRNPGLVKRHDGPCRKKERDQRHIPMVCGSDGEIYDVPTFLREQERNPELYEKPMSYCSRQPGNGRDPPGPQ